MDLVSIAETDQHGRVGVAVQRVAEDDAGQSGGCVEQYVSLAERPRKGLPSATLVKAIDNALGVGGALLGLHPTS